MEEQLRTVVPSKGGRGRMDRRTNLEREAVLTKGMAKVRKTHVVQTSTSPVTQNRTQDRQGEARAVLRRQWKTR